MPLSAGPGSAAERAAHTCIHIVLRSYQVVPRMCLGHRYVKIEVLAVVCPGCIQVAFGLYLSELMLVRTDARVPCAHAAAATRVQTCV